MLLQFKSLYLRLLHFPEKAIALADWFLGISITLLLSTIVVRTIPIFVSTLDATLSDASTSTARTPLSFYPKFRSLIPLFEQCLKLTCYIGTAGLICQYSAPVKWLSPYTKQVIGIIVVYFLSQVAVELSRLIVDQWGTTRSSQLGICEVEQQRWKTLAPLFKNCFKYLIYFGSVVCILGLFEVSILLILSSFSILGAAFSLGAQNLVQDAISGLIILFDNTYAVGDYIKVGRLEERSIEGLVETIELRTTHIRHPNGQLQLVRNSTVGSVVNYSKQYAYATVNVTLDPQGNLENIYTLIEEVGRSLKQQYPESVMEASQVDGLESISMHAVVIRTTTKVYPGQHQYTQRLLRQRLKERFELLNQEQQAKKYAVHLSEDGIKSLSMAEQPLRHRQTNETEQSVGYSSQPSDSSIFDSVMQGQANPKMKRQALRSRLKLDSLIQRVWHLLKLPRK